MPSSARITDRQPADRHPGNMEERRRCLTATGTRHDIRAMTANTAIKTATEATARMPATALAPGLADQTELRLREEEHHPWDGHRPEEPPEVADILLDALPVLRPASPCLMGVAAAILMARVQMLVRCILWRIMSTSANFYPQADADLP